MNVIGQENRYAKFTLWSMSGNLIEDNAADIFASVGISNDPNTICSKFMFSALNNHFKNAVKMNSSSRTHNLSELRMSVKSSADNSLNDGSLTIFLKFSHTIFMHVLANSLHLFAFDKCQNMIAVLASISVCKNYWHSSRNVIISYSVAAIRSIQLIHFECIDEL